MPDMATTSPQANPMFNPLDPKTWLPMPSKNLLADTGTAEGDKAALAYGMVPVPDVHVYNGMQGLASIGQGIAQAQAKSQNRDILNQILASQNARQKQAADALTTYANGGVAAPQPAAATRPQPVKRDMGTTAPAQATAPAQPAQPPAQYNFAQPSSPDARPAIMGGGMALSQPQPAPPAPAKDMASSTPSAATSPAAMGGTQPERQAPATAAPTQAQANASPVPSTTRPQTAPQDNRMSEVDGKIAQIDQQIRAASALFSNPANAAYAQAEVTRLQQMRNQYAQVKINQMDPQVQMKQRAEEMALKKAEFDLATQQRQADIMNRYMDKKYGGATPVIGGQQGAPAPNASPVQGGPQAQAAPQSGIPSAAAPVSTALAGNGQMPSGTFPGGMNAQPGIESSMVPLSQRAQDAQDMLELGTMTGNRGMVQGANDILAADPTQEARKKQSVDMGADAAVISAKRRAGTNILRSFAQLQHSFDETPDDVLHGAIGPYATAPYGKPGWIDSVVPSFISPNVEGMTPPQAAAAYPYSPMTRLYGNKDSWDTQNLFSHDVHGLTNALMTGGGKGLNMSDERQKAFDATMKDFMKATSRDKAQEILGHAKTIIMNDFHLTPQEAEQAIHGHMREIQVGQLQSMPLEKLQKMDPKKMTTEQLKIAHDRIEAGR